MQVKCKACGHGVVHHNSDECCMLDCKCWHNRTDVYEAHIAALEAVISDAPHGVECASFACSCCGEFVIDHDGCNRFTARPCDCWKSRALSGAPAAKNEDTQRLEFCICAAIRMPDSEVIHGHRHDDCLNTVRKRPGHDRLAIVKAEQGFVTSHGRFVDRIEGMLIQRAAGRKSWYAPPGEVLAEPRELHGDMLFSEDLYPNGPMPAIDAAMKAGGHVD